MLIVAHQAKTIITTQVATTTTVVAAKVLVGHSAWTVTVPTQLRNNMATWMGDLLLVFITDHPLRQSNSSLA